MSGAHTPKSGRRRVLYVENSLAFGGSCFSLLRLLRGLDLASYEPIVLLPASHPAGAEFRAAGVDVLQPETSQHRGGNTPSRNIAGALGSVSPSLGTAYLAARQLWVFLRRDVPAARRLARLMRQKRIDLVHHNDGPARNRSSVLAAGWARIPQICHVRAFEQLSFIDQRVAKRPACFIYVSKAVESHCRTQGIGSKRGRVVYNPIDCKTFVWDGDRGRIRAELGCKPGDLVVSNIGRVTWWKGQDDFLLAMAMVARREPRIRALIVGGVEPTHRDQEYAAHLQHLASEKGIAGKVVFTGFRRDLPAILAASDLVVHCPTQPEPLGLVVLEAMAAGRPVVATATGGIPEMVEHGVTGLLKPPKDTSGIADSILMLLEDPAHAADLGQKAQQSIRERFSIAGHAAAIQEVYAGCLRSSHMACPGMPR